MGTLIANGVGSDPLAPDSRQHVVTLGDGYKLAAYLVGSSLYVYTWNPTTSTWTYQNPGGLSGYTAYVAASIDVCANSAGTVVMIAGTDSNGNGLHLVRIAWDSTGHAISSVTHAALGGTIQSPAVCWDSSRSYWHLGFTIPAQNNALMLCAVADGTISTLAILNTQIGVLAAPFFLQLRMLAGASTLHVIAASTVGSNCSLQVTPVAVGTGYTAGATELPASSGAGTFGAIGAEYDTTSTGSPLDLVWSLPTGILAVRRTGTNTYGATTSVWSSGGGGSGTGVALGVAFNPSSGDLTVVFLTTINNANGDIYTVRRRSGIWGTASGFLTGGAVSAIGAGRATDSSNKADVLYTSSLALYSTSVAAGSVPNAPTLSPSGAVTGTTPTFTKTYSNPDPTDAQSGTEIQIHRVSDGALMWDSGRMAGSGTSFTCGVGSNTGDPNYSAPIALTAGVAYTAQARDWDTTLGSVSAYGAAITFTPYAAPVVSITGVTSNGVPVVAGGTMTSPLLTATVSFSQANSDTLATLVLQLLASDQTTVLASQTITGLSVASGANYTSLANNFAANTPLPTGETYYLRASIIDSRGLTAQSATYQLIAAWAQPAAVLNPYANVNANPQAGAVLLSWTLPTDPTVNSVTLQCRKTGSGDAWQVLKSGAPFSKATVYPPLEVAYDYQVLTTSDLGIGSMPVTMGNVTLPLLADMYGMVMNSVANPGVNPVPLGGVDSWDTTTGMDKHENALVVVPDGCSQPKAWFDLTDYSGAQQRKAWVPYGDNQPNGAPSGPTLRASLLALRRQPVLYRDIDGEMFICIIQNVRPGRVDGNNYLLQWDFTEIGNYDTPWIVE